jgi:hypothetical protein
MTPPIIYYEAAAFAIGGGCLITYLAIQYVRRWWGR